MRAATVAGFAFAVMAGPVGWAASSPAAWLEWSAPDVPDACGNGESFSGRVEQALGRSPALAAEAAHVSVRIRIFRAMTAGAPARWIGEIHLRGGGQQELGARTLDRPDVSCGPLVDALAVVTALALADDRALSPPDAPRDEPPLAGSPAVPATPATPATPASAPPPPVPGAEPSPVPVAPSATPPRDPMPSLARGDQPVLSQVQTPRPSPMRTGVEGGAKVGVGLLPRMALGAEVSAYLHLHLRPRPDKDWKLFLAFAGWERQTMLDDRGRGASFDRLEIGVGLCPLTVAWGGWIGSACVRGDVGRLQIAGIGFATSSTENRLTLGGGAGVELDRPIAGPLAIGVTAAGMAPLIRDRISYATSGGAVQSIFRQAPLAAIGTLRLSCVF